MTPSRRLSAGVAAFVLAGSLAGCGQDNPFGQIVREGTAPTQASSSPDDPFTGFTTGPSESPEESFTSFGTGTPDETESATETEDATATTSSPAATTSTTAPSTSTTTSPSSTSAPAATSRSATSTPEGSRVQVDGRTITGVPAGLGFPDGAKVSATNAFSDAGASVVLSAPAESAIFFYYRSALPGAGYRIVSDTDGTLAFTGHGYRGTLVGTGQGGVLTWAAQG